MTPYSKESMDFEKLEELNNSLSQAHLYKRMMLNGHQIDKFLDLYVWITEEFIDPNKIPLKKALAWLKFCQNSMCAVLSSPQLDTMSLE